MPSLDNWLASPDGFPLTVNRSVTTGKRIQEKPTSIIIRRGVTQLAAQAVRIEPMSMYAMNTMQGVNNQQSGIPMMVVGYRNHPTVANTDIQRGDRFTVETRLYEVKDVIAGLTDRVLAKCEVVT